MKLRFSFNLDLLEFEIGQKRHRQHKPALGRAPKKIGFQSDALEIAERLVVEQFKHGRGFAVSLEYDHARLRVGPKIGNEKAALAKHDGAA